MADLDALASQLDDARRSPRSINPFTDDDPSLDVEAGYAIQDLVVDLRCAAGELLVGAKVGGVSRTARCDLGHHEPLYGWLTDAMLLEVDEELDVARYLQPRVEPEITFILDRDLDDPATTTADVMAATAAVLPALEVLDCHFVDWRVRLADLVADNGAAARFVLGPTPIEIGSMDLRTLGCVFERNGEIVATATGAEVLGHPAAAVAWLVRRLAARGRGIESGMIVLSGALTSAVHVRAGDVVTASFDRIGGLQLTCR